MATYNSINYTRYFFVYCSSLVSLGDETLMYMKRGAFSSSMTRKPYSAIPHDQWINMTMSSKINGGSICISNKPYLVERNIHTATPSQRSLLH